MEMFALRTKQFIITTFFVLLVSLPLYEESRAQEIVREEIVVNLRIPRLMTRDIIVQYDGEHIYLPMIELFSILEIPVHVDKERGIYSGQYLTENNKYEINTQKAYARSFSKEFIIEPSSFSISTTEFFLRIDLYQEIFQLPFQFNFSNLSILLPLKKDFPAFQRLKRKAAQDLLLQKEIQEQHVYPLDREFYYFRGGVADWTISTSPMGGSRIHYYSLALGGVLMGGDFEMLGNGNTKTGVQSSQSISRWHYYSGNNKFLTQVSVGDINSDGEFATSLRGLQLSNKPQVQRRYFQTIRIYDFIGEGWEVELYVNNVLTDVVYTDQSGEYEFLVDIFYGSSRVMLKLYGPNGELETKEQFTRIPYNLIPKGEFEYSFSLGRSKYGDQKPFMSQTSTYYGILSNLTAGISTQLPLAPADTVKAEIAARVDYQPIGSLILGTALIPGREFTFGANFNEPSYLSATGSFTKYVSPSFESRLRQNYNITTSLSSPLRIKSHYIGLRFHLSHDVYETQRSTNMSYGVGTTASLFHFNYIGRYKIKTISERKSNDISSQLILSIRKIRFVNPQIRADYSHTDKSFIKYGLLLTKRVFTTGQISIAIDRNIISKSNSISLIFNLFNSFASFSTRGLYANREIGINQTQSGSILFDQADTRLLFDRRRRIGSGSAVIKPYLDENYNGVLDDGEEILPGLKANIKGIAGRSYGKNKMYYYDRLQAYDEYTIEIDPYSLDNPMLKPTNEHYQVTVNPNIVTQIEVPLVLGSEVNGTIKQRIGENEIGLGGLRIFVLNISKDIVTEITSFADGEYYYIGLIPGVYRAYVDPKQLEMYGLIAEPAVREFIIKPIEGGTVIEDISFIVKEK